MSFELPDSLKNLGPAEETKLVLLRGVLAIAVSLWIEKFRELSFEERTVIAKESAQIVVEKGDMLLYRSKKKGESAKAFNALARGIALCAFQPGGVKIFGLKFEDGE